MKYSFYIAALTICLWLSQTGNADHAGSEKVRERETSNSMPLPENENLYDLKEVCGRGTYYSAMEKTITPKLQELAETPTRMSNDEALEAGKGVGVKLDKKNYNFHINYPNAAMGGRSYGWSSGNVGDWSDRKFLDELEQVSAESPEDLSNFFETIIKMLGKCDASGLASLDKRGQQVANNFLAIYTAEQYRAMVGSSRWDDALLQVTMLAAFHGGQDKFAKFYEGEFSDTAPDQSKCVYKRDKDGVEERDAQLNDYWQFGRTAVKKNGRCTGRSGINITRADFEKMGAAITKFEKAAKNKTLAKIQKVVGDGPNVIKAISQYYTNNEASRGETDGLAADVAAFMVQINKDANKISKSLNKE